MSVRLSLQNRVVHESSGVSGYRSEDQTLKRFPVLIVDRCCNTVKSIPVELGIDRLVEGRQRPVVDTRVHTPRALSRSNLHKAIVGQGAHRSIEPDLVCYYFTQPRR